MYASVIICMFECGCACVVIHMYFMVYGVYACVVIRMCMVCLCVRGYLYACVCGHLYVVEYVDVCYMHEIVGG